MRKKSAEATEIDRLRIELADTKRELEDEKLWRMNACQAHAILSAGIKKALRLKHWPDFYKLYGSGLFATGVARLLIEEVGKLRMKNVRV